MVAVKTSTSNLDVLTTSLDLLLFFLFCFVYYYLHFPFLLLCLLSVFILHCFVIRGRNNPQGPYKQFWAKTTWLLFWIESSVGGTCNKTKQRNFNIFLVQMIYKTINVEMVNERVYQERFIHCVKQLDSKEGYLSCNLQTSTNSLQLWKMISHFRPLFRNVHVKYFRS